MKGYNRKFDVRACEARTNIKFSAPLFYIPEASHNLCGKDFVTC